MTQVPLTASHAIQNKLLTFHANVWLHLQHTGQIFRYIIWKITREGRRIAWCGAFNTSNNCRIHLPSPPRICILGLRTSHLKMVFSSNVANHFVVYDVYMVLWPCIYCWEKHIQESQIANLDRSKISRTSKNMHCILPLFHLCSVV